MNINNLLEQRKERTGLARVQNKFATIDKLLQQKQKFNADSVYSISNLFSTENKAEREKSIFKKAKKNIEQKIPVEEEKKQEEPKKDNKFGIGDFLSKLGAARSAGKVLSLLKFLNPTGLLALAALGIGIAVASKTNLFSAIGSAIGGIRIPGLPSLGEIAEGIQGALPQLPSLPSLPGTKPTPTVTGGTADFWTLAAITSLESSNPQGQADIAQAIYNRVASRSNFGQGSNHTIKGHVLAKGQFQPVRETDGGYATWAKIQDKRTAIQVLSKHPRGRDATSMIERAAANITNPSLQANAAQWVGGRTDFAQPGAANKYPGGIGFKTRHGHLFGWYVGPGSIAYGKTNPKPAAVPNFNTQQTAPSPKASGKNIMGKTGDQITKTSPYGKRRHPITGKLQLHAGVDLGLNANTPFTINENGKIVSAGWYNGYGNIVDVWLPSSGRMIRIAHLNKVYVKEGQQFTAGTTLGLSGSTGNSTGPHFHVEVRKSSDPYAPTIPPSNSDLKKLIINPKTVPVKNTAKGGPVKSLESNAPVVVPFAQMTPPPKKERYPTMSPIGSANYYDMQDLSWMIR